mmetsp:Transcript_82519/g.237283  ORF Transcript_82519/g.237283 Transcript_82519/m.237283 type:complete len:165 (-) Transcript_82519:20-514(-)
MQMPPTTSFSPKLSPKTKAANIVAHTGSDAKMTPASAPSTFAMAQVSTYSTPAVVTTPIQAKVASVEVSEERSDRTPYGLADVGERAPKSYFQPRPRGWAAAPRRPRNRAADKGPAPRAEGEEPEREQGRGAEAAAHRLPRPPALGCAEIRHRRSLHSGKAMGT